MQVYEAIIGRKSIRTFKDNPVSEDDTKRVLEAARWAPSGLNNQPWKFRVLDSSQRDLAASCTRYGDVIKNAPASIAVFLDLDDSYDYVKDVQACGACIQNMLLTIHDLGLGGVWLGEILNRKEKVNELLGIDGNLELMGVVSFGVPEGGGSSNRKKIEDLLV